VHPTQFASNAAKFFCLWQRSGDTKPHRLPLLWRQVLLRKNLTQASDFIGHGRHYVTMPLVHRAVDARSHHSLVTVDQGAHRPTVLLPESGQAINLVGGFGLEVKVYSVGTTKALRQSVSLRWAWLT
jgi:hypothetical protein